MKIREKWENDSSEADEKGNLRKGAKVEPKRERTE